ncbi:hypothetical protein [Paraflavitalea sp. CAU 1676]|uniref:hypothetical protein n=1 Tax=Paraflavitalea sp. CAU 1676 TaxID=3032598 RepID=UPI0023DB76AA|nr:hypothetical protein [Paraflavitalea sp. CAU 1676]MDF2190529.1 hypothetical protein [Paraflavitalea sp. CAU 1676]
MQITDRNTAIRLLIPSNHLAFSIDGTDLELSKLKPHLQDTLNNLRSDFRSKIQFLTNPLFDNFLSTSKNGCTPREEDYEINQSGTFIRSSGKGQTTTIFYQVQLSGCKKKSDFNGTLIILNTLSSLSQPFLIFFCIVENNKINSYLTSDAIRKGIQPKSFTSNVSDLLLYLNHTSFETKVVPGASTLNHGGITYHNKTILPVEFLFNA